MSDEAPIVGIDLGTTNSLISIFREGQPKLVPNSLGSVLTPSAVGLADDGSVLVGAAAKARLTTHADRTTARFKRYMGTDQQVQLGRKNYRAEELSALVLRSLKEDAEHYLDAKIHHAVISVPAYFNHVQRKATIAAANMADLSVTRLINEPTAAALSYGLQDRTAESKFLVIDLGGGTFDVSILEMFSGVMEVRSSAGDAFLGGEDFTDTLAAALAEKAKLDVAAMDPDSKARLRQLADQIKHRLSDEQSVQASYVSGEQKIEIQISRSEFEEINAPVLKRLRLPIQRAISDAGLVAADMDRIITVGGATRMPAVRGLVTRLFKRFPEHDIDPDHVVALGAAVQAGLAQRSEALEDIVMTDVAPFTLGYETTRHIGDQTEGGHFRPLIERNTVVPVSRAVESYPLKLGQNCILYKIYQGEAPFVRDNVKLGELNVPIPVNMKEKEEVSLRYTYDSSGVLEVLAKVISTGREHRVVIEGNPGVLSAAEIEDRLKALSRLKIHPRDQQVNSAFLARLSACYENVLGAERSFVGKLIERFSAALISQDDKIVAETLQDISVALESIEEKDVF